MLGFQAVPKNLDDVVPVPAGYSVTVDDPARRSDRRRRPTYANNGTDTNFAQRIGDHGDALYWYGLSSTGARDDNSSTRGLLVQNFENLSVQYLHPNGPTQPGGARPAAEAIKEIEAHGVGIVEYRDGGNRQWTWVQNSTFNRRITPNTPIVFHRPVRGNDICSRPSRDLRRRRYRHHQQLRQRPHAVGHQPHFRGELGGLFPSQRRRRCRAPRAS